MASLALLLSLVGAGAAGAAKRATELTPTISWPLELVAEGKRLAVFQPQIRSWENQQKVEAVSAVAFYPDTTKEERHLGWVKLIANTEADLDRRLARVSDIQVAEIHFPGVPQAEPKLQAAVETLIPPDGVVIELDRLTTGVELSQLRQKQQQLKSDPPRIFVSFQPAILLQMDGKPIESPIQGVEGLEFVVNTNWDLFKDGGTYYLRHGASWMQAKDVEGPWQPAGKLPKEFKFLPRRDENWADVVLNVPGRKLTADKMPKVFTSLEPAELILVDDKPRYEPVGDTGLLWLANTDADVFRDGPEGDHYFLVSGRWFRAKTLEDATWTFATPELPKGFQHIPEDHPRADVLASVPGTVAATDAIVLAAIPQKATVKKDTAAPKVEYVGEAQFEPIPDTKVSRAINTQHDVLMVNGRYYLCHQGIWFEAGVPAGPWEVATTVPPEIYTIPASSPAHNVTYVQVYESTADEVVFGYTAGYMGVYWGWGTMMYGSGWYYPPYWGGGYYYPYWPTYGMAASYNPATGMYGRGAYVYGPYGGAGRAAFYNPTTGTYARAGAAYGPYRSGAWASAYNPRTGTSARTLQGSSVYGDWGTSVVRNGDDWVRTGHVSGDNGSLRGFKTSEGGSGFVGRSGDDIYAGGDDNVYRRQDGDWQKYENGGWSDAGRPEGGDRPSQGGPSTRPAGSESRPAAGTQPSRGSGARPGTSDLSVPRDYGRTPTTTQLDRDAYNRARGSSTYSRSQSWRSSGGMNRASAYGGGGRMRGGGGMRRR